MIFRSIAVTCLVLVAVACGGGPATTTNGPTASSVSVQPKDLPAGMVKCDLTGDIDSFINKEKNADPATYKSTSDEWASAKKNGATAAATAFYTDSATHCKSVGSSSSDVTTATFKLAVNFVVQFKDEASAAKGYTSESIFGFSASSLKSGGAPVVEGTKTGLTANSISLNASISSQSFYVAVWQNKAFMVILAVLNVDPAASKKVATSENARIK
jgi:hypothetical protein